MRLEMFKWLEKATLLPTFRGLPQIWVLHTCPFDPTGNAQSQVEDYTKQPMGEPHLRLR